MVFGLRQHINRRESSSSYDIEKHHHRQRLGELITEKIPFEKDEENTKQYDGMGYTVDWYKIEIFVARVDSLRLFKEKMMSFLQPHLMAKHLEKVSKLISEFANEP